MAPARPPRHPLEVVPCGTEELRKNRAREGEGRGTCEYALWYLFDASRFHCARGVPPICTLYILHDTVIAIVTVNHSSDDNNDETGMQETYDTRGRTRWPGIATCLSLMRRNLTYRERYSIWHVCATQVADLRKTFAPCA